jgi:acyl carrier protein phosphodiesterase
LQQVLAGMQRRLSRPAVLDGALEELERLYDPLLADFREFYPQLQAFAASQQRLA